MTSFRGVRTGCGEGILSAALFILPLEGFSPSSEEPADKGLPPPVFFVEAMLQVRAVASRRDE